MSELLSWNEMMASLNKEPENNIPKSNDKLKNFIEIIQEMEHDELCALMDDLFSSNPHFLNAISMDPFEHTITVINLK